jgi:hypothetical protein
VLVGGISKKWLNISDIGTVTMSTKNNSRKNVLNVLNGEGVNADLM